jgi:hypothetical protein
MRYLKTFESFNKVAFHGYMMDPDDMQLPECELEWTPGKDSGCPSFSDSPKITKEDENLAIKYLDQKDINTLIAYSRGGAILAMCKAVSEGKNLSAKAIKKYKVTKADLRKRK